MTANQYLLIYFSFYFNGRLGFSVVDILLKWEDGKKIIMYKVNYVSMYLSEEDMYAVYTKNVINCNVSVKQSKTQISKTAAEKM